jgi:hypothetical protein
MGTLCQGASSLQMITGGLSPIFHKSGSPVNILLPETGSPQPQAAIA